ncbi:MAG TPA: protein translocase subunit SecF, partial [Blastocatellia bacterium]|nr:protein translocase subunit SecF [Blastocatellia bacterium]
ELFRDPKINWIGWKKTFIFVTIALLLLGAISVQVLGFNLGVDFTGGTLLTVRFKQPPELADIRSALGEAGIDTNKVTLQPDLSRPNELLIRAPQLRAGTEAERRVDEDKRAIIGALQKLNPEGQTAIGKVNINTINPEGIEQELRQADPLGIAGQTFAGSHPYRQVGEQAVAFRDQQQKGFIQDINSIQSINLVADNLPQGLDQNQIKSALLNRFYAGKIDLNLAGTGEIEDALTRINPLGPGTPGETYRKAAEAISQYRRDRSGVINSLEEIQVQDVSANLLEKMAPYFTTGSFAVISADVVGPQVGEELRKRAIYVTLAALAGMLIYIAFRFEWIYGVAAVTAVFHDVLITLGVFSLIQQEIDLTVIAALLTLVGYSMNDTIVIFDRIRENLRLRRRDSLAQLTNDSINQTLSRTVITSGLTFLSVVAIVLFGGDVLRGFGLALTIGILVGSYSTFAIAGPIMLWWEYFTNKPGRGKLAEARARSSEQTLAKA